jgi:hypothetical protein
MSALEAGVKRHGRTSAVAQAQMGQAVGEERHSGLLGFSFDKLPHQRCER